MIKNLGGSVVLGMLLAILLMSEKAIAEGDSMAGAKFFTSLRCASCHGKDGKGQGPAAKAMKIKASDWTDKAAMEMLKDDFLKDIINKGGKAVNKSKRPTRGQRQWCCPRLFALRHSWSGMSRLCYRWV